MKEFPKTELHTEQHDSPNSSTLSRKQRETEFLQPESPDEYLLIQSLLAQISANALALMW